MASKLTDAQIVECTLAFCKQQEIVIGPSQAIGLSFHLLPTICVARATAKRLSLSKKERDEAKAAGVKFDDPTETCAAVIVNPSSGSLVEDYRSQNSVAYKTSRFHDWIYEYSTNLAAASLLQPGVEQPASAPIVEEDPLPFCCSEVEEFWRWSSSGLHGLEQKDIDNEARCSAFIRRSGTFDDIIFQVKTHDMSGPANYGPATDKTFYQLLDDKRIRSSRDFDCQLDAYRNYCCKKCKKFFTLNTFTVRDEMKSLMHKQALYNFFTDAGVLVPPKAEARKAVDDEDEDE